MNDLLDGVPMLTAFRGETYEPEHDFKRLAGLLQRVHDFMAPGGWHTLADISAACGGSEASVSARLRDLRRKEYGAHTIERERQSPFTGVWIYRMTQ